MISYIKARQSVIVIRIKHTVIICNADISVTVTVLSDLGSVRYRFETVLVRLTVIDICVLFGSVICTLVSCTAAPIVVRVKFLPA